MRTRAAGMLFGLLAALPPAHGAELGIATGFSVGLWETDQDGSYQVASGDAGVVLGFGSADAWKLRVRVAWVDGDGPLDVRYDGESANLTLGWRLNDNRRVALRLGPTVGFARMRADADAGTPAPDFTMTSGGLAMTLDIALSRRSKLFIELVPRYTRVRYEDGAPDEILHEYVTLRLGVLLGE